MAHRMLSFTKDRKVYWGDTLAGTIEPMLTAAGKWGFIPEPGARLVPNGLRAPLYYNKQHELKSRLRRLVHLANVRI